MAIEQKETLDAESLEQIKRSIAENPSENLDELNSLISDLQAKKRKLEESELIEEDKESLVEFPYANITLKLDKNGSDTDLEKLTPPEVLFLCSEHHANAGGNPIVRFSGMGKKTKVDPRVLREHLCRKYSRKKIMALFPGTEPSMPLTFTRAVRIGIETEMAEEKLLSFEVKPLGRGED